MKTVRQFRTVSAKQSSSRTSPRPPEVDWVHQFLIVLASTDPLVWRRIQVLESYSFWDLHVAIQDAMGWSDCHLHEFKVFTDGQRGRVERLGLPAEEFGDEHPIRPGWTVPISDVLVRGLLPLLYLYDFGGGVDAQQGRQYDVAPDGRFLINTMLNSAAAPITLIQNWQPEA